MGWYILKEGRYNIFFQEGRVQKFKSRVYYFLWIVQDMFKREIIDDRLVGE